MQCSGAKTVDKDVNSDNLFASLCDDLVPSFQFLEEPFHVNNSELDGTLDLFPTSSTNNVDLLKQQVHSGQQSANVYVTQVPSTNNCVGNWQSSVYDAHLVDQQTGSAFQVDNQTGGSIQIDGFQQKVGGDNNINDEGRQQQQQFQIDTTQQQQQLQQQQQQQQLLQQFQFQQQQQQHQFGQANQQQYMQVGLGIPAGMDMQQLMLVHQQQQGMNMVKKERLRWIPALHQLFVEVVHNLGGAWEAKPKMIVDKMKEHGVQVELNINHIKSHLQKYRESLKGGSQSQSKITNNKRKSCELDDIEIGDEAGCSKINCDFKITTEIQKQSSQFQNQIVENPSVIQNISFADEMQRIPALWEKFNDAMKKQQEQEETLWKVRQSGFKNKMEYDQFIQAGKQHQNMMNQLIESYSKWNMRYEHIIQTTNQNQLQDKESNAKITNKISSSTSAVATQCDVPFEQPQNNNNNNDNQNLNIQDQGCSKIY